MKVRAKHWINYNGTWHKGGEEFEIDDSEILDGVEFVEAAQEEQQAATPVEPEPEFQSEIFPPEEEAPKRRGRPRKNPD